MGVQGRIGVAIFSLVTGYVCALKPIRQYREGNQTAAFRGIAKSAFRRVPRLVLPATLATILIWLLCQFRAFEIANSAEGQWLRDSSPNTSLGLGPAILDLMRALSETWTRLYNVYDINQWTLLPLLKGAMLVYVMLFATAYCKPVYRMLVSLFLCVYFFITNDGKLPMNESYLLFSNLVKRHLECNSSSASFSPSFLNQRTTPHGAMPINGLHVLFLLHSSFLASS